MLDEAQFNKEFEVTTNEILKLLDGKELRFAVPVLGFALASMYGRSDRSIENLDRVLATISKQAELIRKTHLEEKE